MTVERLKAEIAFLAVLAGLAAGVYVYLNWSSVEPKLRAFTFRWGLGTTEQNLQTFKDQIKSNP